MGRLARVAQWQPLLIGFFALAALGLKAPDFVLPLGQDQGLYHYVGQEILRGGLPYRDVWDVKPPAVFYTHAAIQAPLEDPWRECNLGPFPGLSRNVLSPICGSLVFHLVDWFYTLAAGGMAFLLARRFGLGAPWTAWVFGAFVLFASLSVVNAEGNTPEKYLLLPSMVAMWATLRYLQDQRGRWLAAAGLAGAVAVLYKPTAISVLGAVGLYLALASIRGWHGLRLHALPVIALQIGLPFVAVLLAVFLAFARMGVGNDLLEATVWYNAARASVDRERVVSAAVGAAWRMGRDGLAPLLFLGALGFFCFRRLKFGFLLLLWAALDVGALFLGGTKFTRVYFIQLVPSFALLAVLALRELWAAGTDRRSPALQRGWVALSLAGLLAFTSSFQAGVTMRAWNDYFAHGWSTSTVLWLAQRIRTELPPHETILVWGDLEHLYLLANRRAPTRFIHPVGVSISGDESVFERRQEMMRDLDRTPPALIIVDHRTADEDPDGRLLTNLKTFPEFEHFLERSYQKVRFHGDGGLPGARVTVYARLEPAPVCDRMTSCVVPEEGGERPA